MGKGRGVKGAGGGVIVICGDCEMIIGQEVSRPRCIFFVLQLSVV